MIRRGDVTDIAWVFARLEIKVGGGGGGGLYPKPTKL